MKHPIVRVDDAGLVIRALRKQAGIRIDDFAATAGVSKQFMTDLENGKATVQMGKVLGLLTSMGVRLVMELPDTAAQAVDAERLRRARRTARLSPGRQRPPSDA